MQQAWWAANIWSPSCSISLRIQMQEVNIATQVLSRLGYIDHALQHILCGCDLHLMDQMNIHSVIIHDYKFSS